MSMGSDATSIGGGRALVVDVPLAGDGTNTASVNALATLRGQIQAVRSTCNSIMIARCAPMPTGRSASSKSSSTTYTPSQTDV